MRAKGVAAADPQICAAAERPKLDHEWPWKIFNARKRTDVSIDDLFDEIEDPPEPPPKQELAHPELPIDAPRPDPPTPAAPP